MYVGGMGATYSALGVTFALIGKAGDFGTQLANPWIVFPLVILFLALAASMFGAFDLNLPSGSRPSSTKSAAAASAVRSRWVSSAASSPRRAPVRSSPACSRPSRRRATSGSAATLLFTYAIGMGVLFWVLAAFALSLPKSGRWMEGVKSAGGIGLLFAAIYYLKPFIPWIRTLGSPACWFLGAAFVLAVVGILIGADPPVVPRAMGRAHSQSDSASRWCSPARSACGCGG